MHSLIHFQLELLDCCFQRFNFTTVYFEITTNEIGSRDYKNVRETRQEILALETFFCVGWVILKSSVFKLVYNCSKWITHK